MELYHSIAGGGFAVILRVNDDIVEYIHFKRLTDAESIMRGQVPEKKGKLISGSFFRFLANYRKGTRTGCRSFSC
jgi:hypothetical protein